MPCVLHEVLSSLSVQSAGHSVQHLGCSNAHLTEPAGCSPSSSTPSSSMNAISAAVAGSSASSSTSLPSSNTSSKSSPVSSRGSVELHSHRQNAKYAEDLHDENFDRLADTGRRVTGKIEGLLTWLLCCCFCLLCFPGTLLWLGLFKVIVLQYRQCQKAGTGNITTAWVQYNRSEGGRT